MKTAFIWGFHGYVFYPGGFYLRFSRVNVFFTSGGFYLRLSRVYVFYPRAFIWSFHGYMFFIPGAFEPTVATRKFYCDVVFSWVGGDCSHKSAAHLQQSFLSLPYIKIHLTARGPCHPQSPSFDQKVEKMSKFTLEAANFTQISGKKDLNFGLHSPLLWKVQYFITSPPMMLSWRGGSRISHSGAGSANLLGRDTNSRGGYLLETIEPGPTGWGAHAGCAPWIGQWADERNQDTL